MSDVNIFSKIEMNAHLEPVKIGSIIAIGSIRGYGGHLAHIEVKKLNKKSYVGIEGKGSYSPGREWRIHVGCSHAILGKNTDGFIVYRWENQ